MTRNGIWLCEDLTKDPLAKGFEGLFRGEEMNRVTMMKMISMLVEIVMLTMMLLMMITILIILEKIKVRCSSV